MSTSPNPTDQFAQVTALVTKLQGDETSLAADIAILAAEAKNISSGTNPGTVPDYTSVIAALTALDTKLNGDESSLTGITFGGGTSPTPTPTPTPGTATAGPVTLPLTTAPVKWPNMPLGINPDTTAYRPFFPGSVYSTPVAGLPVHPLSKGIIAALAAANVKPSIDCAFTLNVVDTTLQANAWQTEEVTDTANSQAVLFPSNNQLWIENGSGPNQFTVPAGSDAHALTIDRATGFGFESIGTTSATTANAAMFHDLLSPNPQLDDEATSMAADGWAILDGVITYAEAVSEAGILHAARLTIGEAVKIAIHAFMRPCCHGAGSVPPGTANAGYLGMVLRLPPTWVPITGVAISSLSVVNKNLIKHAMTYGYRIADTGDEGNLSSDSGPWGGPDGSDPDIFQLMGRNNTLGLSLADFEVVDTGQPLVVYDGITPPAGFISEAKGAVPAFKSFTALKDTTGAYTVITPTVTGANRVWIDGLPPFRPGDTITIPYKSGQVFNATALNNFGRVTATATVA